MAILPLKTVQNGDLKQFGFWKEPKYSFKNAKIILQLLAISDHF